MEQLTYVRLQKALECVCMGGGISWQSCPKKAGVGFWKRSLAFKYISWSENKKVRSKMVLRVNPNSVDFNF